MNRSIIEAYAAGGPRLAKAIEGLTDAEMRAHPIPGTWSVKELVLHMMDSEMMSFGRMRRIFAEEKPLLIGYDESAFVKNLRYNDMDPRPAAEIFRLLREVMSATLRAMPDEAFERQGVHSERGLITAGALVELYVWHLDHHMKFLLDKRKALGKPL